MVDLVPNRLDAVVMGWGARAHLFDLVSRLRRLEFPL